MEAMEAILSRRSIRNFTETPVSDEQIQHILKAAMNAPSAGNQQPWHFIVIRDRKITDQVHEFHPYAKMLKQAQVAILICGDPSLELHKGYWMIDCAAATENILLGTHAIGLGAVWLGIFPRDERVTGMRRICKVPDHIIPFALVAIGQAAEAKPPANRFHQSKIHNDTW